ncbi:MAG: ROK family transcriptional regulator [Chloroflexota bacterium]|nr:ROK family transcriptional regulator [Chloroflexota bacterium]
MEPSTNNFLYPEDGHASSSELSMTARVLNIIRNEHEISRTDIARIIDGSRSAVVQHVERLLSYGLIREVGVAASTGGRRARVLALNGNAGYIAGVDHGATSIDVAITNLAGEILSHISDEADVSEGPERCLSRARDMIKRSLDNAHISPERLWAIGIGMPGPVEFKTGRPVAPPIMPGWDGYPVREYFAPSFTCPVYVDNDVNVMALGEQWTGLGHGIENFLFIKVGTGIGCGIVCHGQLYRGADGCAGDIGHIQVNGQTVICRCGNLGCLEAVAAAPAWVRMAHEAANRSTLIADHLTRHNTLMAKDVSDFAGRGDHTCVEIIQKSGRYIGHILAGLVNFFNPSLIVIGGDVSKTGDVWLAAIRQEIYRRSLPLGSRNLLVQRSQLRDLAGVIGATAFAVQQLFSEEGLSRLLHQITQPGAVIEMSESS